MTRGLLLLAFLLGPDARAQAPCPTDVEYALTGQLTLSDTPMGKGNGTYAIGPGSATLRFDGNKVKMLAYEMHESFTVRSTVLAWTMTVTTEATSTAKPSRARDDCALATGTLVGRTVHWLEPVRDYRTDGTLTCRGSFCGKFGVPPRGTTPLHVVVDQRFNDFVFSPDDKTFTMATIAAARTEMPKQSSAVSAAGREVRRGCASSACAH